MNPWDADPIIGQLDAAPWENDPVIGTAVLDEPEIPTPTRFPDDPALGSARFKHFERSQLAPALSAQYQTMAQAEGLPLNPVDERQFVRGYLDRTIPLTPQEAAYVDQIERMERLRPGYSPDPTKIAPPDPYDPQVGYRGGLVPEALSDVTYEAARGAAAGTAQMGRDVYSLGNRPAELVVGLVGADSIRRNIDDYRTTFTEGVKTLSNDILPQTKAAASSPFGPAAVAGVIGQQAPQVVGAMTLGPAAPITIAGIQSAEQSATEIHDLAAGQGYSEVEADAMALAGGAVVGGATALLEKLSPLTKMAGGKSIGKNIFEKVIRGAIGEIPVEMGQQAVQEAMPYITALKPAERDELLASLDRIGMSGYYGGASGGAFGLIQGAQEALTPNNPYDLRAPKSLTGSPAGPTAVEQFGGYVPSTPQLPGLAAPLAEPRMTSLSGLPAADPTVIAPQSSSLAERVEAAPPPRLDSLAGAPDGPTAVESFGQGEVPSASPRLLSQPIEPRFLPGRPLYLGGAVLRETTDGRWAAMDLTEQRPVTALYDDPVAAAQAWADRLDEAEAPPEPAPALNTTLPAPARSVPEILKAIGAGEPVSIKEASVAPVTHKALARKYGNAEVPVSDAAFQMAGIAPAPILADYLYLQGKHPEYFPTPADAQRHVEHVMEAPTSVEPGNQPDHWLFARVNETGAAVVLDVEIKQERYRVVSAYVLSDAQTRARSPGRTAVLKPGPANQPLDAAPPPEALNQGHGVPSDTLQPGQGDESIIDAPAPPVKQNPDSALSTQDSALRQSPPGPAQQQKGGVSEAAPAPAGVSQASKEPWQMTRDEYLLKNVAENQRRVGLMRGADLAGDKKAVRRLAREIDRADAASRLSHRIFVRNALASGKSVPPEVLADYPDMQRATQQDQTHGSQTTPGGDRADAQTAGMVEQGRAAAPPAPAAPAQSAEKPLSTQSSSLNANFDWRAARPGVILADGSVLIAKNLRKGAAMVQARKTGGRVIDAGVHGGWAVVRSPGRPAGAPRFTRSGLERQIESELASLGIADTLESSNAENDILTSKVKPFTFLNKLPGEVRDFLEGRAHLRRLFKVATNAADAGGEDTMSEMGQDAYFAMVERLAGDRTRRAVEMIEKERPTPRLEFLAALWRNLPPTRLKRGGRWIANPDRPAQQDADPAAMPTGTTFEVNGEPFEIVEEEDGYRVLKDGDDYPAVSADAVGEIPVDQGTIRMPQSDSSEQDLPPVPDEPFGDIAAESPSADDEPGPLLTTEERAALNAPLEEPAPDADAHHINVDDKASFLRGLVEVLRLSQEQADAAAALMDARAAVWQSWTGIEPDEFYRKSWRGITDAPAPGDALNQGDDAAAAQAWREKGVESPWFKRWFGDWRAAAKLNALREVNGSQQAKEAAKSFLDDPLTNLDSGIAATVSATSLSKMLSRSAWGGSMSVPAHMRAVGNLDTLFPLAVLRQSRSDRNRNADVAAMHHFEVPMPFEGQVLRVKILAKQLAAKEQGTRLYSVEAVEIRKPASFEGEPAETASSQLAGFRDKFDALLDAVKGKVSKVVDADGKPLVVYHGTANDFVVFNADQKERWSGTRQNGGFYFTESPVGAAKYAKFAAAPHASPDAGEAIKPVYLSLKNPKIVHVGPDEASSVRSIHAIQARAEGYDGVIVTGSGEAGNGFDKPRVFVAFRPEQIKSATGNRGTFDPAKSDILYQAAFHGSPYTFDRFSTAKIGTGEGAQAYGYGLYFADRKEVAQSYRDSFRKRNVTKARSEIARVLGENGREGFVNVDDDMIDAIMAFAKERNVSHAKHRNRELRNYPDATIERAFDVANELQARLYEVELAPSEDEYLDWDKPLSQQSQTVKTAMAGLGFTGVEPVEIAAKRQRIQARIDGLMSRSDNLAKPNPRLNRQISKLLDQRDRLGTTPNMTGAMLYRTLLARHANDLTNDNADYSSDARDVSMKLRKIGIRGTKYLDGGSRPNGEGSYNYVIFDDADVEIKAMHQSRKAAIAFAADGRAVLHALEKPDVSSVIHEIGHLFRRDLYALAGQTGDARMRRDIKLFENWAGAKDGNWNNAAEEKFARGFERYAADGKGPPFLQRVFAKLAEWLRNIYGTILNSDIDVKITPQVRAAFDRLLTSAKQDADGVSAAALNAPLEEPAPEPRGTGGTGGTAASRTPNADFVPPQGGKAGTLGGAVNGDLQHALASLNQVVSTHGSVARGARNTELGWVTLDWGQAGDPARDFAGGHGISHIVAQRGEDAARGVIEAIVRGRVVRRYGPPGGTRADISDGQATAVVSLFRHGNKETWLLTGWKEGPDDAGGNVAPSGTTLAGPTLNRPGEGAGPANTIDALGPPVKENPPEAALTEDELGRIWINTRGETKARRLAARAELQRRGFPVPTAGRPQRKRHWVTQKPTDLSQEEVEANFQAEHDRLIAQGAILVDESQSGSRYYRMPDGQMFRVADHAPNAATQEWIDRNDVEEIRVDLKRRARPGGSSAALIAPAEGSEFDPPAGGTLGTDADVVRITGEELGTGALPLLRVRARAYADSHFANTTVHNRDDGSEILIPPHGIKTALAHQSGPDKVRAIVAIPQLLERGRKIGVEPDRRGRPEIKAVHRYAARLEIGDRRFDVRLVVREHVDGKRYYDHDLTEIKEPAGENSGGSTLASRSPTRPTAGSSQDTIDAQGGPVKENPARSSGGSSAALIAPAEESGFQPPAGGSMGTLRQDQPPPRPIRPVPMPPLVRLATALLGGTKPLVRKLRGNKYGIFRPGNADTGGRPAIEIDYAAAKDPTGLQLAHTLAHEIGHLVDYLPEETLSRGSMGKWVKGHKNQDLGKRLRSMLAHMKIVGPHVKESVLRKELKALSAWWRGPIPDGDKYRNSGRELYADALSVLLNSPGDLQSRAPNFYAEFFKYLDAKPDVKREYFAVQEFLAGTPEEIAEINRQHIVAGYAEGEKLWRIALERLRQRRLGVGRAIAQGLLDKSAPVVSAENKVLGSLLPGDAQKVVRHALDELGYAENVNRLMLDRINREVSEPMKAAGIEFDDVGVYLQMRRIAEGDRGGQQVKARDTLIAMAEAEAGVKAWPLVRKWVNEQIETAKKEKDKDGMASLQTLLAQAEGGLANPEGYTPKDAREQLADLKRKYGDVKYAQLENFVRIWRDIYWPSIEEAVRLGVYSQKAFDTLLKPNKDSYATFAVLDYLTSRVKSGIYKQVGTFKSVADPMTATTMKMMTLNRLNELQKAKLAVVPFLQKNMPQDIGEKGVIDAFHREKHVEGRENLFMHEDGKLIYYPVDPYVARVFRSHDIGMLAQLGAAVSNVTYRVFHPLYVTYNIGWQLQNYKRDITRSYKNLAAAHAGKTTWRQMLESVLDIGRLARAYKRAAPHAARRARGQYDPLINEMLARRELDTPFVQADVEDASTKQMDRMMQAAGLGPPRYNRHAVLRFFQRIGGAVEAMGVFSETLPKVASHKVLAGLPGIDGSRASYIVRNFVGTPNIRRRGSATAITNPVLMYSNVMIQGLRADAEVGLNPSSAAGYWTRSMLISFLPKTLMLAAAWGLLGDELEELMAHISEYEKSKYLILPIGWTTSADGSRKAVYLRLADDDANRLLSGVYWKLANGDRPRLTESLALLTGELPSVSPPFEIAGKWISYATGRNPTEDFRGRDIIPADEFKTGGAAALKPMLAWTGRQFGAASDLGMWLLGDDGESPATQTEATIESIPGLNRLLKISDRGISERRWNEIEAEERKRAAIKVAMPEKVRDALSERYRLNRFGEERLTEPEKQRRLDLNAWYRDSYLPGLRGLEQGKDEEKQHWDMEAMLPESVR